MQSACSSSTKNILLLCTAFNALTQQCLIKLKRQEHLNVSYAVVKNDEEMIAAVEEYRPHLIIAPILKKAIPEVIWQNILCLIVHPGPQGDRGPSSLDWAIMQERTEWGVTLIKANGEFDAGDVYDTRSFPIVSGMSKSAIYNEWVVPLAVEMVVNAVSHLGPINPLKRGASSALTPAMKQSDRAIDWEHDNTATIIKKINAADSFPGVLSTLAGERVYLYHPILPTMTNEREERQKLRPGEIIAQSKTGAILLQTIDGSVWITHLRKRGEKGKSFLKLPATTVLDSLVNVPFDDSFSETRIEKINDEIFLFHFPFYNGAMGTEQCKTMLKSLRQLKRQEKKLKILILSGGPVFWSNGIHLHLIEAAADPELEAWKNINAINDIIEELLLSHDILIYSAMQGNAGAGGVPLALAGDLVFLRAGRTLNPHYANLGLFGSEYWTFLLPRRIGTVAAYELAQSLPGRPLDDEEALKWGLVDEIINGTPHSFMQDIILKAKALTDPQNIDLYHQKIQEKKHQRRIEELVHPLRHYRDHELGKMKNDVYSNLRQFREKRHSFVYKI